MCGITGLFAFNPVGRINLVHLEAATRCLEKRGPDFQNTWFDEIVGLGHRRLSIIDTSEAGHQPMADSQKRYHIIFNGEIYNYLQLKKELLQLGHEFHSDSDTEVLLHAYMEWGVELLPKLNGFFAFAIYDNKAKSLFVARDRYGIKPLLYTVDEHRLIFASEMKAILAYGVPKILNKEALNIYFQLTYVPAPLTLVEGVKKLMPSHYLIVRDGEVSEHKYYEFPYTEKPTIKDLESAKSQLVKTLRKSVVDRLVSDVPLGAFLSGGIDSSVIACLASEAVPGLKTFSIGFRDNKYFDETHYAQMVAEKFKTDHHVFYLTNQDLLGAVKNVVDYIDEPFADSSALPVYILSNETRKHVTVALSGDGADEIFSGYNKHSAWLQTSQQSTKSRMIGNLAPLWKQLPKSRNNRLTDVFRKLDRFATAHSLSVQERYWFLASFIPESQVWSLLKSDYITSDMEYKAATISKIKSGDINEVLALDSQMVLQGDMLQKVDLMSMANGLEVRVPFLDPNVVALAFQMESSLKIGPAGRKIVLREAFRDMLPEQLYTRPKHGFEVPLLEWFRRELKTELDRVVFNESKIEAQGIFEYKEIARIKKRLHSFDPGDSPVLVWSLYVFQNWYDRYFS